LADRTQASATEAVEEGKVASTADGPSTIYCVYCACVHCSRVRYAGVGTADIFIVHNRRRSSKSLAGKIGRSQKIRHNGRHQRRKTLNSPDLPAAQNLDPGLNSTESLSRIFAPAAYRPMPSVRPIDVFSANVRPARVAAMPPGISPGSGRDRAYPQRPVQLIPSS